MTIAGRVVALFPILHFALIGISLCQFIVTGDLMFLGLSIFFVYGFPVLLFRLHNMFFPLTESSIDISLRKYNPWWTSHQLQLLFISVPLFEGVIHLVPGLYSVWLRLWGSNVGRAVYWTPKVEILDRSLLDIGDGVVVGHMAAFCCHVIMPVEGKMLLIIRRIRVGARAFVGAEGRLGPGAVLEPGKMLRTRTAIYWKGVYKE